MNDAFDSSELPVESRLPAFDGATAWLNTEPRTAQDLEGRVVLVDFCTYTCINWIRTLPYIRAWANEYGPRGLAVVGVHTPEFTVEHDIDNVRRALQDMDVDYPMALDNDYAIWDGFANRYWPALYIADADGRIRHHHFGEGGYEKSEQVIRGLLADIGTVGLPAGLIPVDPQGIEAQADWRAVRSSETYIGLQRSDGFASPGGGFFEEAHAYSLPTRLLPNQWALEGTWTFRTEDAIANEANGRIAYRFHARDLNLILGTPSDGSPVRFRVRLDGQGPNDAHGLDVDREGNGQVTWTRLYQLIRQSGSITDHVFEVEFLDPGASALCFTFG